MGIILWPCQSLYMRSMRSRFTRGELGREFRCSAISLSLSPLSSVLCPLSPLSLSLSVYVYVYIHICMCVCTYLCMYVLFFEASG